MLSLSSKVDKMRLQVVFTMTLITGLCVFKLLLMSINLGCFSFAFAFIFANNQKIPYVSRLVSPISLVALSLCTCEFLKL